MSIQSLIDDYKKVHTHPLNHLTHAIGIPMILVSLVWVFFNWKIGLALFALGWIFQFVGHAFEGKAPAFFSNPTFLLIGPLWLFKKLKNAVRPPVQDRNGKTSSNSQRFIIEGRRTQKGCDDEAHHQPHLKLHHP